MVTILDTINPDAKRVRHPEKAHRPDTEVMQFYEGRADWDAIRAVRDVISIPLIANGDVETAGDAQEILRRSGADAVMIGRGCQGRPWHAGVISGAPPPQSLKIADIAVEHYRMMLDFYGEAVAIRHARKHLGWYLQRFAPDLSGAEKAEIMTSRDPREVAARLYDALAASIVDSREAA